MSRRAQLYHSDFREWPRSGRPPRMRSGLRSPGSLIETQNLNLREEFGSKTAPKLPTCFAPPKKRHVNETKKPCSVSPGRSPPRPYRRPPEMAKSDNMRRGSVSGATLKKCFPWYVLLPEKTYINVICYPGCIWMYRLCLHSAHSITPHVNDN